MNSELTWNCREKNGAKVVLFALFVITLNYTRPKGLGSWRHIGLPLKWNAKENKVKKCSWGLNMQRNMTIKTNFGGGGALNFLQTFLENFVGRVGGSYSPPPIHSPRRSANNRVPPQDMMQRFVMSFLSYHTEMNPAWKEEDKELWQTHKCISAKCLNYMQTSL